MGADTAEFLSADIDILSTQPLEERELLDNGAAGIAEFVQRDDGVIRDG